MARNLQQSEVVVLGGAGFIGSHIVDELLRTDVGQVVVFDNFTRGRRENLQDALHDNRVRVVEGDITHTDVLNAALEGADVVFHLAALWLLHCQEFPRAAFEVNIAGTFNVLEACRNQRVQRLV
jgi:UDP-glucose 4-epimerase